MVSLRRRRNKKNLLIALGVLGVLGCSTQSSNRAPTPDSLSTEKVPPVADSKIPMKALDFPDFTAWVGPDQVVDSGILNVIVEPKTTGWKEVQGQFGFGTFPMMVRSDGKFQAVVAIPIDWPAGDQNIGLKWIEAGVAKSARIPFKTVSMTYHYETLSVAPKTVEPPAKDIPRILREQKRLAAAYRNTVDQKLWIGGFIRPIDSEPTSAFGNRRVYNGVKNAPHFGLDLRAKVGTPVKASAPGRVVYSANTYFGGYTVILDHGYSLFTVYAHLSKLKVRSGAQVQRGQVIALSGATGRVTGPHLHWGVQIHGVKVNPEHLLGLE